MKKEIFILDSNAYITPHRNYYAGDIIPTYWDKLVPHISAKEIVLLDMVRAEIEKGQDSLAEWLLEQDFEICWHATPKIVQNYGQIMNYIQNCGYYNEKGLDSWAQNDVADPWIIASAMANGYTVVTFEQSVGNLTHMGIIGKVKIPDVAKYFGVECISLFEMMRKLRIKI